MKEFKKQMIYATMYLGDRAAGSQLMFNVPVGQPMPAMFGPEATCNHCGRYDRSPTQTAEHTNIQQAGQFGSAIGDVCLTSVQAKTSDGREQRSSIDLASFSLRVCGRRVGCWTLSDLLGEPVPLPRIAVARTDTFEGELALPPGAVLKRPDKTSPLFVKIEFWADIGPEGEIALPGTYLKQGVPR